MSIAPHTQPLRPITQAELESIMLKHEKFNQTKIGGARGNLSFCDLTGLNLAGRDLAFADFTGAVLARANLLRVRLDGATLFAADLRHANLIGASMVKADRKS
ncbi:MAG TPA: pentapeptide repeat-containing protein, partial [Rhodospirillaceae bacterium]|nr:pentapeptide repeat-containing protein [Rhodospirillaceae bacterium]